MKKHSRPRLNILAFCTSLVSSGGGVHHAVLKFCSIIFSVLQHVQCICIFFAMFLFARTCMAFLSVAMILYTRYGSCGVYACEAEESTCSILDLWDSDFSLKPPRGTIRLIKPKGTVTISWANLSPGELWHQCYVSSP